MRRKSRGSLQGLQLDKATEDDRIYLSSKIDKDVPMNKIAVPVTEGKRFYVAAGIIKIMENDLYYGVLRIFGK